MRATPAAMLSTEGAMLSAYGEVAEMGIERNFI